MTEPRPPEVVVRRARPEEAHVVALVLMEAADWLRDQGRPLWLEHELLPEDIAEDSASGLYHLAFVGDEIAGTLRYQLEDPDFWPEVEPGTSAFIHRLAVRRKFAGRRVSFPLLEWAVRHTRSIGRDFLRLDCEAHRPKLKAFYEDFGFRHHSDARVGPFFLSRYELDVNAPGAAGTRAPAGRAVGDARS